MRSFLLKVADLVWGLRSKQSVSKAQRDPYRVKEIISKYDSIEAWVKGENVPMPLRGCSFEEQNRYLTQFGALRRHLYEKHIKTLPQEQQDRIAAGTHPSQSNQYIEEAQAYIPKFKERLTELGIEYDNVEYDLNYYPSVVLTVCISKDDAIPFVQRFSWFFEGFEVKIRRLPANHENE